MQIKTYDRWLEEDYVPIAGGAMESNIMGLWFAKQTGKGSFVTFTTGTKRARWVGGDFQVNRTDGEEAWSDQTLFSAHVDFVNTLVGSGAPVIQGQTSLVAYLSYLACGQEAVLGGENEIWLFKATAAITGGEFTLELKTITGTFKAGPFTKESTGKQIVEAMVKEFPGSQWQLANLKVTGEAGKVTAWNTVPLEIEFIKEFAAQPVPLLTIKENVAIVGGPIVYSESQKGLLYKHVATPNSGGGFWCGVFKSVGKSVTYRAQFNDCRIQSLRIEGSSASKVVKITPTILSLNPGESEYAASDPSTVDDNLKPFIYTEAQGTLEMDGVVFHGISAFAFLFSWGLNEYYGDAVHPYDLINNVATASIEGLTLLIDQQGFERYNSIIYGAANPTTGTKPIETLPLLGSYKVKFERKSPTTNGVTEALILEMPGVKWSPTLSIPANPAGGAVELSFTGQMRKEGGLGEGPETVIGVKKTWAQETQTPYSKWKNQNAPAWVPFRITTEEYLDPAFSS